MWPCPSSLNIFNSKPKKNIDNKLNGKLLIMKTFIYSNKQDTGEINHTPKKNGNKCTKIDYDCDEINKILKCMMVQNNYYSPGNMD